MDLSGAEVRRRAAAGVLALGLRTVVVRAIAIVGTLVLARELAPHDFGLISLGLSVMVAGRFLSDAGVGAALVRRAESPERRELECLEGFQLAVTVTFVLLLATLAAPRGRAGEITAIMAGGLVIETLRIPAVLSLQRKLTWGPLVRAEIADTVGFYAWAIGAVALGFGVIGVAIGSIVRSLINTAVVLSMTRVLVRPRFSLRGVRSMLGFGVAFQATQLLSLVRDQGVNFLTGAIGGVAMLGLWNLAYRFLSPVWLLFQSVWRVSYPAMARLLAAGEDPAPTIRRALGLMAVTTGVVLVPLTAVSPALVPTLLGSEWGPVVYLIPPAALGMLIVGPLSTCLTGYLYAVGRPGVMVRSLLLDTCCWFVVAFPLLPVLGVEMVALGMLAGFSAEALVLYRAGRRSIDLAPGRTLLLPTAVAVISGGAGWLLALGLGEGPTSMVVAGLGAEGLFIALVGVLAREPLVDAAGLLARTLRRARPGRPTVSVAQTS